MGQDIRRRPPVNDGNALLLAIARSHDREAYERLFTFFAPRIKAWMLRAGMTPGAAEELAQEAMLKVWRKAALFDPARASASTWIFAIARNLRIDRQRRDHGADLPITDVSDAPEAPVDGESALLGAEREARVHAALAALSAEQATIIRLSYFEEKPQTQIAQELDIPLGTVKSRVRLAIGRLRSLLDDAS